ncbi:AAC(3) family N-acetyltransferase [Dictyoglomus turgidum]|uniref:AAC(3) family N-acetyltransferase n=1 Tax=Dictyoglomus turgidum TaxID=513050 RepID=UPI0023523755|nr:AAC(3) family N-acetyltransferase [Dictyoglomus turgidum]
MRESNKSFVRKEDIVGKIRGQGIKEGDIMLVHSSLRSFGYVEGGAETVIDALLESVGEEGTVIVPTITAKSTDSPENPPIFDVNNTPCWTGIIPETFRKRKEAKRSLHPTHSAAAIGGLRDLIIEGHEFSESPCDKNSPYYKNAERNGYIMLIGVDQNSNTSIHSCEEIVGVPYHLQEEFTQVYITGYDGEKILVRNRLHNWNKPPTDFNKIESLLLEKSIMKIFHIGNSTIRLIKASQMFDMLIDILTKNPLFLLKNPKEYNHFKRR